MKGFFHNRNSVRRGGGRKSQKRHLSTSQGQHSTAFCATEEENSETQEHLKSVCKPSSEGVTVATNRQLFPSRDHLISLYHINFIINDIIDIMYIYTYTYILINICKPSYKPICAFPKSSILNQPSTITYIIIRHPFGDTSNFSA